MASSASATAPSSRKRPAPLTKLARKYGHPYKKIKDMSHRILKYTGKSGITPLSPFFPQNMQNRTPRSRRQKYQFHFYQKHRYQGFAAAELHGMEALSALDTTKTSSPLIKNPIHPMFAKDKWDGDNDIPRHWPLLPLFTGHKGFWQISNTTVWQILEPALRLASCLLSNASVWPWWDALFNGSYNNVKASRIPPEYRHLTLITFHARSPDIQASQGARNQLMQDILEIHEEIRFGFFSGYTNPITHLPRSQKTTDKYIFGSTNTLPYEDHTKVWIAVELLQPLLRDDLTDSERMSNSFRVATTIIHECAHAIWERLSSRHPSIIPTEPYFEDEPLCEIGWSLEDKLWGGFGYDIVGPEMSLGGPGLPNMGIYFSKWFTEEHNRYRSDVPTLDHYNEISDAQAEKDPFYSIVDWPISTTWTNKIFQAYTWDTLVRQFGAAATQMGPLTFGTQRYAWHQQRYDNTAELRSWNLAHLPIDISMTADQAARLKEENRRRAQASSIIELITNDRAFQKAYGNLDPDNHRDGSLDAFDSQSDTDDEEDEKIPTCPRWREIRQYLFNTRNPSDLAWDSMTFDIPEWTLYRYIQMRGGLVITPEEWHEFLVFADHQKELFQCRFTPWTGTVERIATGWPTNPAPLPPESKHPPKPSAISTFEQVVQTDGFLHDFYYQFRDFRDIDYGALLKFVNIFLRQSAHLTRSDIFDVVDHWARVGKYVTWGPYCVARLTINIPQRIKDKIDTPPPSPVGQGSRSSPQAKTQEELDLEKFEKEVEDSGLGFEMSEFDPSSSEEEDDSGIVS